MSPGDIVQCVDASKPRTLMPGEEWVLVKGDLYCVVEILRAIPHAGGQIQDLLRVRAFSDGAESPNPGLGYFPKRFRPFIEKPPAGARIPIEEVARNALQDHDDRMRRGAGLNFSHGGHIHFGGGSGLTRRAK